MFASLSSPSPPAYEDPKASEASPFINGVMGEIQAFLVRVGRACGLAQWSSVESLHIVVSRVFGVLVCQRI